MTDMIERLETPLFTSAAVLDTGPIELSAVTLNVGLVSVVIATWNSRVVPACHGDARSTAGTGSILRRGRESVSATRISRYAYAVTRGGDVPIGCMERSTGGHPPKFDGSRRSPGGLTSESPRCLSDSRLHKTMAQYTSHPQRDACSSMRAGSFTEAQSPSRDAQGRTAGTSREQATVELNRLQRPSGRPGFALGAANRS
jgi:hypothetical protein